MQTWVAAAFASAFFAGMVSILAKYGIKTTDSDVATALRICVVLVFTWVMVAVVGSAGQRFLGPGFLCSAISWTRWILRAPKTGDAASAVLLAVAAYKPMLCRAAPLFGEHDIQDLRIDVRHADVGYPGYVGYALLRRSGAYAIAFSQGGALNCHLRR